MVVVVERVPKIIINDKAFQTRTVSQCCLIELLPYILSEKYINIVALSFSALTLLGGRQEKHRACKN